MQTGPVCNVIQIARRALAQRCPHAPRVRPCVQPYTVDNVLKFVLLEQSRL